MSLRVLRIFHAGRNPAHRARDRALVEAGAEIVYVVPDHWPEPGSEETLSPEPFTIEEVRLRRAGDVNRHRYADPQAVADLPRRHNVDLVDLCEESFSAAAGQLLPLLPADLPVVMYSAQNLDKRWPPPFFFYERRSFRRVSAFYPCSRQAASVLRSQGYAGLVEPLPLGYDDAVFKPGNQNIDERPLRLALVGRMVLDKGVHDAVEVVAALARRGVKAELTLAGSGPATTSTLDLARRLGFAGHVHHVPWLDPSGLAALYRRTHIVLAPSRSTPTWVEQFGRMIVEAQACGCVVVGYTSGSIAEVGGEAAVLVTEGDITGLAQEIAGVIDDAERFDRLRRAGLELANDRTWSAVATRQLALYQAAVKEETHPLLAGGPADRRRKAAEEFGPPASALGQDRPFALPILRQPGPATKALGAALDMASELRSRPHPESA